MLDAHRDSGSGWQWDTNLFIYFWPPWLLTKLLVQLLLLLLLLQVERCLGKFMLKVMQTFLQTFLQNVPSPTFPDIDHDVQKLRVPSWMLDNCDTSIWCMYHGRMILFSFCHFRLGQLLMYTDCGDVKIQNALMKTFGLQVFVEIIIIFAQKQPCLLIAL